MWAELAAVYMTEESEDETTGVVRQHHIPWQSESMQACLLSTVQLTCNVVLTHVREIVRSREPSGGVVTQILLVGLHFILSL